MNKYMNQKRLFKNSAWHLDFTSFHGNLWAEWHGWEDGRKPFRVFGVFSDTKPYHEREGEYVFACYLNACLLLYGLSM